MTAKIKSQDPGHASKDSRARPGSRQLGKKKIAKTGTYTLRPTESQQRNLLNAQHALKESTMTGTIYKLARLYPQHIQRIEDQDQELADLRRIKREHLDLISRINAIRNYTEGFNGREKT